MDPYNTNINSEPTSWSINLDPKEQKPMMIKEWLSYLSKIFRQTFMSKQCINRPKCFNLYHSLGIFSRRQIDDICLFFPENRIWHFMQIVSLGDNLHEMSILFSEKNKKNISKCRLLKILPRVLSVKDERVSETFILGVYIFRHSAVLKSPFFYFCHFMASLQFQWYLAYFDVKKNDLLWGWFRILKD